MKLNLHENSKHNHLAYKIGVSGAADVSFLGPQALEMAKELGRELARQNVVMVSGATTGFPYWAAVGCKEERGVSIGFSPAESAKEHLNVYKLPLDYMDLIIYTGFGYDGRDLLFTRSTDGIIIGPGRIGTIHEFTICYEDGKPIGILEGQGLWNTDEVIKMIMEKSHRVNPKVIFDTDPRRLVERVKKMIDEDKKLLRYYENGQTAVDSAPPLRSDRIL